MQCSAGTGRWFVGLARTRQLDCARDKAMIRIRFHNTDCTRLPPSLPARLLAGVFVFVFAASIASCTPKLATRGNLPSDNKLSQVSVGVHKKDDVRAILGAPSTIGTFEDSVWYYIGQNTSQLAFFREKIAKQKVIVVVFGDLGVVEQLEVFDQDALREISLIERTTPTAGNSLGFFEQILVNIGRFNK